MEGGDPTDSADHPQVLENENPTFLTTGFGTVLQCLQSYGWLLILAAVLYYYFKDKIDQQMSSVQRKVDNMRDNATFDPETAHKRQLAMDEARRRLQEKYDQDAARHAEKQKEKEEEKRKEQIEDWDRHLQGKGYRSKYKASGEASTSGASGSAPKKPAPKRTYRDDEYSPLMGGGAGGFRPSRRSGGGMRGG